MASPQLENGFAKLANELLEAFAKFRLSSNEYQIIFIILRKTYGFSKKEDIISVGQFNKLTGLCNSVIYRCLARLEIKNIIIKRKVKSRNLISIQKDYDKWDNSSSTATTKRQQKKVKKMIADTINNSKLATKNNSNTAIHNIKERKKESIQSHTSSNILNELKVAGLNKNHIINLENKYN